MKILLFITGLLLPFLVNAQVINGTVSDEAGEPLVGATVYWANSNVGTLTNEKGEFQVAAPEKEPKLVASFVGYLSDTIDLAKSSTVAFYLKPGQQLGEVVIQTRKDGVIISDMTAIKTEQITQTELRKAACCDLAGCFETQATVQPQTTNIITNSKELRILGLSGVYNQILIDGFPMIQGLTYTYGVSSVPGTLVDNIFVSKGANSVLQGFESISGQINVETKDPDDDEQLLLNVYVNSFLEKQANANYAFKHKKWSNRTAIHTVQPADRVDRDEDGFMDLPLLTRYMIFNKWKYGNSADWGWNSQIGLRYLNEERIGGQTSFDAENDSGTTTAYGQTVNINQPEINARAGYRFNDAHNITVFTSAFFQDQSSFFGTVSYNAQQTNFYTNAQYELNYKQHNLKSGFSYRHLNLQEEIAFADTLNRTYNGTYEGVEHIPGFFAENTMRFLDDNLTWIAGLRADRHNQFGVKFTPRTLIKYDLTPKTILRANIGTGWRTVNLFSENIGLLVSSRDIIFAEQLEPEQALNYGVNITQKFETNGQNLSGHISADFYRTDFQNQIFPDYDSSPTTAIIRNFRGTSISNGFQAEFYLSLWQRLAIKGGYNFLDVYRMQGEEKQLLPFNARHKVLGTIGYEPLTNKFRFDLNVHWFGRQRLPDTESNPELFQRPDFSETYAVANTQFTYTIKAFELYSGVENIFNFRQNRPIISWQNPFGPYFDTSSVWGPTRGREIYFGIRYKISK